jgi:hypothetical protein
MTTAPTTMPQRRAPHVLVLVLLGVLLGAAIATPIALLFRNGVSLSSALRGSGRAATQARVLPAFRELELAGSNIVNVRVGGKQSVTVHGDDNLLRYVTTKVDGGRLAIGQSRSFATRSPMSVAVTVPSLNALALSGSGILTVEGVQGGSLRIRLPGSGLLTASGAVDRLDAVVAGSGQLRLGQLVARDATAAVAGSGEIELQATHSLDALVSGSGAILYGGNPGKVTRNVTGSGAIVGR